jgi:uroporphyrinogen decarboxylase
VTGLDRMRRAIRFEHTDRVPVAPLLGAHAMALAGLPYDVASADPAAQARALLNAVELYRPDAVFTLMDLSAEPEALGAQVTASADRTPVVTRHLSPEEVVAGHLEEVILSARVPAFVETVRRLRTALGDTAMVGALVSGPLTAAANAVGIEALARMMRRQREIVADMLDRLTRACMALVSNQLEAGAHGVMVLEPCATSHMLGPRDLETLLLPRLRAISRQIRDADAIAMLHVCGDCQVSLPLLAHSGFSVLSLDSPVDLLAARRETRTRVALMGNLDVRHLLPRGTPTTVSHAAGALVRAMGSNGGFILSTGCEIPPETPRANMAELMRAGQP